MFNSREYEWSDVSILLGGRDVTGIRGVKYTIKQDKETLHAKGSHAHSIQRGNVTIEGEITLLQSELLALQKAGNGSILDLSLNCVVAYGNPSKGIAMTTDIIEHMEFTEVAKEFKQGDKFMETTIPFIALRVKNNAI